MQDAGYVKKAFAGIARRYMLANHVLSMGIDVLWRRKTSSLVAAHQPRLILDLATGSGDLARELQRRCPNAKVLGADFSLPMMREAQAHHFSQLVAADGMNLPFQSGAYDALTVAFGLRNMASWPEALQEMSRVLKTGGRLYVLDFSLPTLPLIRPAYLFYLKKIMPRIAGWITGERAAYEYLCSSVERFPSGSAMEQLIQNAGFTGVKSHRLSLGIASLYIGIKTS
ncbi:demethylmenaquinone methyltransferase/2-methoxy-6-polyprenyl-1,4-benzoquinol methylase [Prosthecobacter fusiformis]|uniref:Demethylmenaquinone methyltransferase n=1 Tax=Prosthecobacter fusiformis TaxID=48464 RepID=A0A4V3FI78_9BACT|nr:ubiquinone/menaquinone biosynthesis methyltransferase [Prosthecobacter fusiformis]TDU81363.1 demethylmenaquinone methyltransferase/2-methoxy-6-polyprenyl-1,4-benzoquinol methylase [Prosthecobacter fusiformis]